MMNDKMMDEETRLSSRRAAVAELPLREQMALKQDTAKLMAFDLDTVAGGIAAAGHMIYMIGRYGDKACTGLA